jgi:hypothetical protein
MLHARGLQRRRLEHRRAGGQPGEILGAQLGRNHDLFERRRIIGRRRECHEQKWNRAKGAQGSVHPYPSAGTSRIRFYGFAAIPHLRPVHRAQATPRRREW